MVVYEPREDSFLLLEAVNELASGKVLDMGTGSGLLAIVAAKSRRVKSVTATDVNKAALKVAATKAKEAGLKIIFVLRNLFQKVPNQKFDTIIFNPPYLPQDKGIRDKAVYGGKKGYETIEAFLNSSSRYLSESGRILLLFSSLTKKRKVDEIISGNCYDYEIFAEKPLFFETLYCYIIKKSQLLQELERRGISSIKKLAKGHRGVVYTGLWKGRAVAVKAERKDVSAARGRARRESKWLRILNRHKIGPKLLFCGKDYFAYEFVNGMFILEFIKSSNKKAIVSVIKKVLHQCHLLDRLELSKEEMHRPVKHIIVTSKRLPVLLDFERCHKSDKPKNVTQFLQFLSGGYVARLLLQKRIGIDEGRIRSLAGLYRKAGCLDKIISYISGL
ncbi:methyltransferase [Candidatus Woesearchaeota archaeon]|nr:methyltransferase [Candidatus Woesearchaeota archaeon]